MKPRRSKKSESIEIRVSYELKSAFMGQAAIEGRPASDILRDCISNYLKRPTEIRRVRRRLSWRSAVAAGFACMALGLPSSDTELPSAAPMPMSLDYVNIVDQPVTSLTFEEGKTAQTRVEVYDMKPL